mgnify:FL=1
MTKKHFVAMAASIKQIRNPKARGIAARRMAKICRQSNPRFDRTRFLSACGV